MTNKVVSPTIKQLETIAQGDRRLLNALVALFSNNETTIPDSFEDALKAPSRSNSLLADNNGKQGLIRSLEEGQLVFISDKWDLPRAVGGVITLAENTTYYVTAEIDLLGDRLLADGLCAIISSTPEIGRITSTGLTGFPLLTSDYTIALRNIGFYDSDYTIELDGSANIDNVLDWNGVNFINCSTIGNIKSYGNAIFNLFGIIESSNLVFKGTFGTLKLDNSLLSGIAGQTTITVDSTVEVTRRIGIFDSAFVSFGGATALDVSTSTIIDDESYIIESCSFNGGSTYVTGVQYNDNKARFINNSGIQNSSQEANYYMIGNATPTPITSGVPTKILGATTEDPLTERFTCTDNRATYNGAITRNFAVHSTAALTSNNNNVLFIYVAKNGVIISQSRATGTANAGGRAEGMFTMALVSLETDDYIEMWVDNNTGNNAITDIDLNVIITESL